MDERQIEIYSAKDVPQAHLLVDLLARRGIEAFVSNASLQGAAGEVPLGWATAPRVSVAEEHAEKAREVVIAFERQIQIGPPQVDDVVPGAETVTDEWPTCPGCGNRRQTVCPVCEVAGTDFPPAEYNVELAPVQSSAPCGSCAQCSPAEAGEEAKEEPKADDGEELPVLLMCATCDEAFQPRYYRLCAWCGHDHGEGIEPPPPPREAFEGRTIAVMLGLACIAAAVCVYLWYLFGA